MSVQTFFETLEIIHCAYCGIPFGVTSDFEQRRRKDHEGFYCPKGHSNYYKGKSEEEKLKQQLKLKQEELEWTERRNAELHNQITHKNNVIRSEKAAKTRIKNRIHNGVCPCCNRSFQNLKNHMKNQHPEYVEAKD